LKYTFCREFNSEYLLWVLLRWHYHWNRPERTACCYCFLGGGKKTSCKSDSLWDASSM